MAGAISKSSALAETKRSKNQSNKSMNKKELIQGQCENCGAEYRFPADLTNINAITCPDCGKYTENWDTVNGSQMAPSIIVIHNNA
jgi:uncharacterized OB-fold protein